MWKDPDIPVMGVGDVDNAIQLVGLFQGKVFLLPLALHLNYLARDAANSIKASRHASTVHSTKAFLYTN